MKRPDGMTIIEIAAHALCQELTTEELNELLGVLDEQGAYKLSRIIRDLINENE